jgi:hypothetical protein
VREEVDLFVVDRLLELPVLVGVFGVHTDNHIWNLGVVADVPTHAPGALQDEDSVSLGLVLCYKDDCLLEVILGVGSGSCLVELRTSLIHQGHTVLVSLYLCIPHEHPIVYILDHPVGVPTGEPDGVV